MKSLKIIQLIFILILNYFFLLIIIQNKFEINKLKIDFI